jgi:hypothetical protein
VQVGPNTFIGGTGRSKKEAEQEVAEIAWGLLSAESLGAESLGADPRDA